jgi:hypothetical protein
MERVLCPRDRHGDGLWDSSPYHVPNGGAAKIMENAALVLEILAAPFFGPLTSLEWSTGMYKHLDHHLKQFGV